MLYVVTIGYYRLILISWYNTGIILLLLSKLITSIMYYDVCVLQLDVRSLVSCNTPFDLCLCLSLCFLNPHNSTVITTLVLSYTDHCSNRNNTWHLWSHLNVLTEGNMIGLDRCLILIYYIIHIIPVRLCWVTLNNK